MINDVIGVRSSKSPSTRLLSSNVTSGIRTHKYSKSQNITQCKPKPLSKDIKCSFKENNRSYYKLSSIYKPQEKIIPTNQQLKVPNLEKNSNGLPSRRTSSINKKIGYPVAGQNSGRIPSNSIENRFRSSSRTLKETLAKRSQNMNITKPPPSPSNPPLSNNKPVSRSDFKFHMVIGKGGFGKVWLVTHIGLKKYFALKEMSKAKHFN